ncbi:MAG: Ig-like domain-containing protein [Bacteroidaceae bacterium]|nr:Ig-like domain-containing protein [Bacteroidaceae bacterium]
MKKLFLFLAALTLGFGQLMAEEVTFSVSALKATLPSDNTNIAIPYTWDGAPAPVTVTLAKEGTTTQSVGTQIQLATGYTITVATTGTLNSVAFATSGNANKLTAESGTYTGSGKSGTWTPAEGTTPSSVVFTTTGSFPLSSITVDYTPKGNVGDDPVTAWTQELTVGVGQTGQIEFTMDGTPAAVTYTSSNTKVATVAANGKVTGVAVGTCTVTTTIDEENGNRWTKETAVTVVQPEAVLVANAATYTGSEPFICDYLTKDIYALNNLGKYEKWGVMEAVNGLEGVTTYEGKLVTNNADNCEYKFVGGAWVNVGSVLPQEIDTETNYKNMQWNEGWTCRHGYESTFNKFVYNEETNTNTIDPYEGQGGFEPYQSFQIDGLNPGDTYKVSFKYSGKAWFSWGGREHYTSMPFYVANTEDITRDLVTYEAGGNILAVASLPNTETTNKEYSLQFDATDDFCVLAVQFGVCEDGSQGFAFSFADLKIERIPVVEQYVNNFKLVSVDNGAYTPLAYIENISAARENAYTLPYIPVTATQIGMKFKVYDTSSGWSAIFCARNTHAGTGISLYMNGNDRAHFGYFTGDTRGAGDNFAPFSLETDYTITADVTKLVVNGTTYETGNTETNATTRALSLFANPEWDNAMRGRIEYCTIAEAEETLFDFKPAMRHDGVFGFYDAASGLFVLPAQGKLDGYSFATLEDQSYIYFTTEPRTMFVGFTAKYEPVVQNIEPAFTWTSSDESIATVAADGTVTGVARGTVTITATDTNSDWTASYVLAVEPATVAANNVEVWDGSSDAILGSIRIDGDQYRFAYTVDINSGMGYNGDYFNHIFGEPAKDESGKAWYEADYAMTNVPEAIWIYGNNVLPNSWSGNMGDVYVRRYFKAEGELPAQLYMPAAHDDAPCEYYINGTLVWARNGYEPGVNGWYEDEIVKLNDEQRALIKTDGSVNVFAYHVHQNWGGRYADGGIYGNSMADNSPSKRFESNENRQRLANAVAQAEGVEGIDPEVLEYAQGATVCLQDAGRALDLVRWELRKALSPRHDFDFASAEPADGLECWLLNVGTGQFLCGSNDWGTHASVEYNISSWPMILHANTSGANRFSIQTNLPNGLRNANDGLGHNGYVDCGYGDDFKTSEGWAWTFEPVGDGTYRIIQSGREAEDGKYLGVTQDYRYQVDTDKAGADNPYNFWKIITRAQLEGLASVATPENPADVSFFIHQNTFSQNDFEGMDKWADNVNAEMEDSKWVRIAGSVWEWKNNNSGGDFVYEMWNCRPDEGKLYLIQDIEGLPAGQYYVECTGYYRDGNWDDAIAGNTRQLAFLYAGTEENCTPLPSIMDGANKGAGYGRLAETLIPDGCTDAQRFFKLNTYAVQSPVVTVGEDGKLQIGVYRPANDDLKGGDWITADNFRLYCVGQENALTVTVGDALYATYVAPVDVDFSYAQVSAYAAQPKTDYVHLEPVTTVPAGTAVVVKAEAAGTYPVAQTTGAALGTDNSLVAATEAVTADGSQYVLAKPEGEEVGFYQVNEGTTIAAGKGYLVITGGSVKPFYGFDPDGATGISGINIDENAVIYNLAGQRVSKAVKGINIINGKKVLK